MVKVTFNSALAQKEAKKDEPKSSEEALIIPPDAVAVDCKVRGRRAGRAGGRAGELPGRGAAGPPGSPFSSSGAPLPPGRSSFVRKCVCAGSRACRGLGLGGPRRGGWEDGAGGPGRGSWARRPRRPAEPRKQARSLAAPPAGKDEPKMADRTASPQPRRRFLLSLRGRAALGPSPSAGSPGV